MEPDKPTYYAIIPASVRYANITANAKLLYGEITALTNKEGYCWATNKYFADLYNVSERSVQNWLTELAQINEIAIDQQSNEHPRRIYLGKDFQGGRKNLQGGDEKIFTRNSTSSNNDVVVSRDTTNAEHSPIEPSKIVTPPKCNIRDEKLATRRSGPLYIFCRTMRTEGICRQDENLCWGYFNYVLNICKPFRDKPEYYGVLTNTIKKHMDTYIRQKQKSLDNQNPLGNLERAFKSHTGG